MIRNSCCQPCDNGDGITETGPEAGILADIARRRQEETVRKAGIQEVPDESPNWVIAKSICMKRRNEK